MANPEHLKILKQGVKVWNRWRDEKNIKPDFNGADLNHADLSDADLSGANFFGANLNGAHLSNADLRGVELINADLIGADLRSASLADANLRSANLSGAYLGDADITDAKLDHAHLIGANLTGAYLMLTTLRKTMLMNADFLEAYMGGTIISSVDLREVKNLLSIRHYGPSSIDIDTIYKSGGNIPEEFLRECGVSEDFITYMRSLVGKAIEFYSCFISYSSKDGEFLKRLYMDLQSEGVRTWYAAEDLKIGDKFRDLIDESILLHDKLLLVLSENSVSSQWVEKEVETALEKEREQGKVVLFPVRLDDAVLEAKTGWAADVRRSRHIGDFSAWKNHDSYRKGFERLMRDLKAEARK